MKHTITLIVTLLTLVSCQNQPKTPWEVIDAKDQFGDATGKKLIQGAFDGEMINSAGKSDLKVLMLIDDETAGLELYEYGNIKKQFPELTGLNLDCKTSDGQVHSIEHFVFKGLILENEDDAFLDLVLSQSAPLKVAINFDGTLYNFEVDPTRLSELMASLKAK